MMSNLGRFAGWRWKLAQFYACRNLSVDQEIAAAIGKTITNVQAVLDNKHRLVVDLELNHGPR